MLCAGAERGRGAAGDPGALYALAKLKHRRTRDPAGAEALYERVVAVEPGAAQAWCDRGCLAVSRGRFAQAEAALKRAAKLAPADPHALLAWAIVRQRHHRDGDGAMRLAQRARALAPSDARALTGYAHITMLATQNLTAAREARPGPARARAPRARALTRRSAAGVPRGVAPGPGPGAPRARACTAPAAPRRAPAAAAPAAPRAGAGGRARGGGRGGGRGAGGAGRVIRGSGGSGGRRCG